MGHLYRWISISLENRFFNVSLKFSMLKDFIDRTSIPLRSWVFGRNVFGAQNMMQIYYTQLSHLKSKKFWFWNYLKTFMFPEFSSHRFNSKFLPDNNKDFRLAHSPSSIILHQNNLELIYKQCHELHRIFHFILCIQIAKQKTN